MTKHDDKFRASGELIRQTFENRPVRITIREIMDALGYSSTSPAVYAANRMIELGYLVKVDGCYYLVQKG